MNYPKVLKCLYFKNDIASAHQERLVKDYEFDFYLGSDRTNYINGKKYDIKPYDLVVKKPGDVVSGIGVFECYMLTLDFSNEKDSFEYNRNNSSQMQPIIDNHLLSILPSVFTPVHKDKCIELMQHLSIYSSEYSSEKKSMVAPIIMEFLCLVAADAYNLLHKDNILPNDFAHICQYMQTHYNSVISTKELSDMLHLNESYFIRKFRKTFGVTPMKYLFDIRMDNAKMRLLNTDLSSGEIAAECGFCDSSYFTHAFKNAFNLTPMEYRISKKMNKSSL